MFFQCRPLPAEDLHDSSFPHGHIGFDNVEPAQFPDNRARHPRQRRRGDIATLVSHSGARSLKVAAKACHAASEGIWSEALILARFSSPPPSCRGSALVVIGPSSNMYFDSVLTASRQGRDSFLTVLTALH